MLWFKNVLHYCSKAPHDSFAPGPALKSTLSVSSTPCSGEDLARRVFQIKLLVTWPNESEFLFLLFSKTLIKFIDSDETSSGIILVPLIPVNNKVVQRQYLSYHSKKRSSNQNLEIES
ncbi:hypothetical protein NPIL_412551 [Nephila pilipes]|uniref:Uncharacterized protein n=1 Tax=Nephila pilipes TaxID=299642 RepID=A0A8X6N720_NEPPI|nr:hypothetical protein NPIL_412551 [Nephila pilipes]